VSLTNAQYDAIHRIYEEKQLASHRELEKRQQYVDTHLPEYTALSRETASLSLTQARLLLEGDEAALTELKQSLARLREKKRDLLKKAGLPEDYLEPEYDCPDCQDTGYINNQKCHCFKQRIISLLYEQSNIKEMLNQQNFSHLSYEYYQGEDLERFQNAVNTCRNFVHSFDRDYHNLFFYGTVGTGKSFLSCCIAKELIDSGHSVIYFSSAGLFERISQNSFDHDAKEALYDLYEDLYSCDLLIVDDLGTELTNAFSSSHFFTILNERILRKKPVIISTNLSLQELRDRYSDRIFSRITSNYELCKITGPDIRVYKKQLSLSNRK
jgi:DNA replication protein DnaC